MIIKHCTDCFYCKEDYAPYSKVWNCTNSRINDKHPSNKAQYMVHGMISKYLDVRCTDARINEDLCGKNAKYFRRAND